MNLSSLGHTVGQWVSRLPVDSNTLVDTVDEFGGTLNNYINAYNEFVDALYAELGLETTNSVPDYHCVTCKGSYAPVEELTTQEMAHFYVDHAKNALADRIAAVELVIETDTFDRWSDVIKQWFVEEREASGIEDIFDEDAQRRG